MIVYFNGKYIDENKVSLSIKDRGFLLGDGVFETILYKNKKLIFFDLHTKRLKRSLKRIFIKNGTVTFKIIRTFIGKIL